jgi:glycosyltransferase involved in cell wall biosynthesis
MWRPHAVAPAGDPASRGGAGLRLALFSGNYNYTRDGANQALNRLVRHLEAAGVAVRIYSPTTATPAFPPAGRLVSAPSMPLPGRGEYRLAFGLTRRLRQDLDTFAPDLVHLSAPDLLGLQAARHARRIGAPVVASLHTRFETYLSYYGLGALRPLAERYLYGFYGRCDRILAPSPPLAALLAAQGLGERVRLWSRGVDRSQFSPTQRDLAWRRALGIGDGHIAVLFLGRLVMEKGLDPFARTLAALREQRPEVRPLIVGDGPAAGWLRRLLPHGVFTGMLTGPELGRAVASADIFFNPSQTEAFGNATLEAMAAGLPVLAPQAPSTRELVVDGVTGVVLADPQPARYADAIAALATDHRTRLRLGHGARAASARYDWAQTCEAVLDVYRELTGAPAPQATAAQA